MSRGDLAEGHLGRPPRTLQSVDKDQLESVKAELKQAYATQIRADARKACDEIDALIEHSARSLPGWLLATNAREAIQMTDADYLSKRQKIAEAQVARSLEFTQSRSKHEAKELHHSALEVLSGRAGSPSDAQPVATPASRAVALAGAPPLGPSACTPQSMRLAAAKAKAAAEGMRGGSPGGQSLASSSSQHKSDRLAQLEQGLQQLQETSGFLQQAHDLPADKSGKWLQKAEPIIMKQVMSAPRPVADEHGWSF
mmetsp:Transcript_64625/g.114956  ORF Transcript_64625/g.114956 Transcript_64625/m.114956 type:complete len:255 (+) Transcript_64625:59-823(+)|eukprot:CAMPEP_0197635206 /NCGR_PEP_ID=MMETSP1338-20131121/11085_1 /TAXON_ID=43686 ORGANISM="Pelagodinium beii, Strain RCC1491" /NCGR_SAMPLE_ID=MMETSP1338 /ASSEMBLY_ACC=CAM_ASM_000754 /LENGTH=254 /DNA_ID=CAMNT_0043207215 /DNA_START=59 /DNA_END=823 /DNA_ORIENTATION=-